MTIFNGIMPAEAKNWFADNYYLALYEGPSHQPQEESFPWIRKSVNGLPKQVPLLSDSRGRRDRQYQYDLVF